MASAGVVDEVVARVAELVALAVSEIAAVSSSRELGVIVGRISSAQSSLDALQTIAARRARELADQGQGPGAVETIQRAGRLSGREARTVARRADVVAVLPSFGDALAAGRLSAEHVDALGRAMLGLDEAKQTELAAFERALLRAAVESGPDLWSKRVRGFVEEIDTSHVRNELERAKKLTRLRIWQDPSRMVQLSASLEPVAGERLWTAIRRETGRLSAANGDLPAVERLSDEQAAAQALINLVAGGHAAQVGPNATDLVVLIGLDHLTGEPGGQQVCETSRGTRLPVDWVRRTAHEARLITLVVDEAGLAVELDRASRRRLATFVQRVMLRAMHDTCVVPGCDVPFDDCEVHHLVRFNGRNTRLGNLAPLCRRHHHDVHDRGWQIALDAHRNITITLPDRTIWAHDDFRPPGADPPPPARSPRASPPRRGQAPDDPEHGDRGSPLPTATGPPVAA